MSKNTSNCSCVKGVGCDVQTCKYHSKTENCCTASHIDVHNNIAMKRDETYCATFVPKTQG